MILFFARTSVKTDTILAIKLGSLCAGYPLDCNKLGTFELEARPATWDIERGIDSIVTSESGGLFWQVLRYATGNFALEGRRVDRRADSLLSTASPNRDQTGRELAVSQTSIVHPSPTQDMPEAQQRAVLL